MMNTSYEFEIAAKNAVISELKRQFSETYCIGQISLVWFAHVLGFKKAILIDNGNNDRLYEVTYNCSKDEMYVDIYEKQSNVCLHDYITQVDI